MIISSAPPNTRLGSAATTFRDIKTWLRDIAVTRRITSRYARYTLSNNQDQEAGQKPIWSEEGKEPEYGPEQCGQGDHAWRAFFFQSGRLAYWQCQFCGQADRQTEQLPERLETISGWIKLPPRLIARGPRPPRSARRWTTTRATILSEGDPSSIYFVGVPIPDLAEAHTYTERDEQGNIRQVYEPRHGQDAPYSNHYTLTRYQVVGNELLQFESYCFEESTFDTPYAGELKQKVVLAGLKQLWP